MIFFWLGKACCSTHKTPISCSDTCIDTFDMLRVLFANTMTILGKYCFEWFPMIGVIRTNSQTWQMLVQFSDCCSWTWSADKRKDFFGFPCICIQEPVFVFLSTYEWPNLINLHWTILFLLRNNRLLSVFFEGFENTLLGNITTNSNVSDACIATQKQKNLLLNNGICSGILIDCLELFFAWLTPIVLIPVGFTSVFYDLSTGTVRAKDGYSDSLHLSI